MRWMTSLRRRGREPILERLDRVAQQLNPLLIVIVIGLAILNISCYAALEIGRLHAQRLGVAEHAAPAVALYQSAVTGLPQS